MQLWTIAVSRADLWSDVPFSTSPFHPRQMVVLLWAKLVSFRNGATEEHPVISSKRMSARFMSCASRGPGRYVLLPRIL
jgi:hypothetical protein